MLLGAALAGALVLAGCSTKPQVEFTPSASHATVTVTVTTTITAPPSGTIAGLTTGMTTDVTAATSPQPTTTAPFIRNLAEQGYSNLVADIGLLDSQFASGRSPSLRLEVLHQHFTELSGFGVPPGLDGPSYLSRVRTLETFAAAAAQESLTDLARSRARYEVIRRETGLLLAQVNGVLRTTYALPVATPRPATTTTTPQRVS